MLSPWLFEVTVSDIIDWPLGTGSKPGLLLILQTYMWQKVALSQAFTLALFQKHCWFSSKCNITVKPVERYFQPTRTSKTTSEPTQGRNRSLAMNVESLSPTKAISSFTNETISRTRMVTRSRVFFVTFATKATTGSLTYEATSSTTSWKLFQRKIFRKMNTMRKDSRNTITGWGSLTRMEK